VGLPEVFAELRNELEGHLNKEETLLFPAIVAYERAAGANQPLPPTRFGTVANPIRVMEAEHESAGAALTSIREITGGFAIPEYACVTYRALMTGLQELEQDLHMHIHLENNILFPRAAELGKSHAR
jgi:regulator of cell morphogenesis and NO signaling